MQKLTPRPGISFSRQAPVLVLLPVFFFVLLCPRLAFLLQTNGQASLPQLEVHIGQRRPYLYLYVCHFCTRISVPSPMSSSVLSQTVTGSVRGIDPESAEREGGSGSISGSGRGRKREGGTDDTGGKSLMINN